MRSMPGAHEHTHARNSLSNHPIGKFRRAGDLERAPHRTFRVGAERNGHLVGPALKRTNQSGSDGPERLDE